MQEDDVMAHVLGLLQHNADEELWSACRDECDECEPAQQGGSLVWIIALHRIQDRLEQALDHLKGDGCHKKHNARHGQRCSLPFLDFCLMFSFFGHK